VRKCIVLNTLKLTSNKQRIFDGFFSEYLRVLNETLKRLPDAKSSTQLHHLTYNSIRENSFLPSDLVQEARKDVWAKRKINRIPYAKFREFLGSSCEEAGAPLQIVDAYHTSKWCPRCGAVNSGHDSKNYSLYRCRCGLVVNSDRKASLAVAVKSALERASHNVTGFAQFSGAKVPVSGLVRPHEAGKSGSVSHASSADGNPTNFSCG
jgi:transposase